MGNLTTITRDPIGNDWERQPGEPSLWYGRFHDYLMLGQGRTIEEAFRKGMQKKAQECKKSGSRRPSRQWYSVFREWDWSARARSYDDSLGVMERERLEREIRDMNLRHAVLARWLFNKVSARIAQINFEDITPALAIRLSVAVVKLERLVLGKPISAGPAENSGTPPGMVGPIQAFVPDEAFLAEVKAILELHDSDKIEARDGHSPSTPRLASAT